MPKRPRRPKRSPDSAADGREAKEAPQAAANLSDSPFAALAPLKAQLAAAEKAKMAKDSWEAAKAKKKLKDAPPPSFESEAAQAALFQAAMQGVTPLRAKSALSRPEPKPASEWQTPGPDQDDLMVMTALTDLVSGRIEFDLTYTDEYVEGHVKKFPPSTMDRLRQGLIPYQDHLDLHGLTLSQAEDAIYDFISKSLSLGRRCLLLIHGRGHRSPDGVPVIKRNLESLLLHRRVKRHILAFTTARPIDGGLGASYIYLAGTS